MMSIGYNQSEINVDKTYLSSETLYLWALATSLPFSQDDTDTTDDTLVNDDVYTGKKSAV